MEFAPSNLNIAKLKQRVDITNLTLQIAAENYYKEGRFYMLWRNGNFIVIQAEPWWRPGVVPDASLPYSSFLEENRALAHIQEVLQTMLDTIVFDGEKNWAYLIRLKDNSYRLVYAKRRLVSICTVWTKVVELDEIELTRFTSGLLWEGVYEGKDVDLFIAWKDEWGEYVSHESRGQKLIESRGLGRYFFELKAHVSKNGAIIGIMMEPVVGRCITSADRSAIFEAVADIQRHGVVLLSFQICDIYITDQGVRFASASNARYYRDGDALAKEAEFTWKILADIFNQMENDPLRGRQGNSRTSPAGAIVIPRLPTPVRSITLTHEEAIIRWAWSIMTCVDADRFKRDPAEESHTTYGLPKHFATRRHQRTKDDNKTLLPPDDHSSDLATSNPRSESTDGPLAVNRGLLTRYHPYERPRSNRLLLPSGI